MALSFAPWGWVWLVLWPPLWILTALGSRRRGESWTTSVLYGFAFPVTWVIWLIRDNHAAGRRAFRSR